MSTDVLLQVPVTVGREWFEPFEHSPAALSRYRRAIERSDACLVISSALRDDDDQILECNAAFLQLMEASRDQVIGASWNVFTLPDDSVDDVESLMAQFAGGQEVIIREKRYRRPGGGDLWAFSCAAPIRDAQGATVAVMRLIADISARKAYEAELGAMDTYAKERAAFIDAMARDSLDLVFQPIFDLETGRVVAVDTVGARDPDRPDVPPRWLLNMAEDLQLGVEFASWVLRHACEERSAWIREGAERNGPHVIVPIPAQMLNAPDVEARIRGCVAEAGACLTGVAIEIDERILTGAAPQIEAPLRALGEDGLRVYIGGFGEGITSISRMRSVPVDGLKGASSFVEGLPGPADLRLLSALVSLGRAADIAIVAEGITSADHLHALQDIGCPLGMGPLLGGRMNAGAIAGLRNRPLTPDVVSGRSTSAPVYEPTSDLGPTLPMGTAADALGSLRARCAAWPTTGASAAPAPPVDTGGSRYRRCGAWAGRRCGRDPSCACSPRSTRRGRSSRTCSKSTGTASRTGPRATCTPASPGGSRARRRGNRWTTGWPASPPQYGLATRSS
jgi:PAS domain S-box-containing protein